MPREFSHTGNTTARLFLAKSLFEDNKNQLIITDNTNDISLLQDFASEIFDEKPIEIKNIGELLANTNNPPKISFCHIDIFRVEGNLHHIKKGNSVIFSRNENISIENLIEKIVELGYEYDPSLSEKYTYKREGGVVSILANNHNYQYHIEWFDTEIDSILSISNDGERTFLDNLILTSKNTKQESETIPPINHDAINELPNLCQNTDIFVMGCDFLAEILLLQKIANIHFSEINTISATSCNIEIPSPENIHSLTNLIKHHQEKNHSILFYTRYISSVEEFLHNNSFKNITIHETKSRKVQSFECEKNSLFPHGMCVIADDILAKIFVKNRRSNSIAKNLDLLISLSPGDFVVHRDHGIGKFVAIIKKKLGELEREYLEIHYAEGDKLFVPLTEIFRISKYLGNQDVILTRLGGKEWTKTLEKTDEELQIIAENILETNAKRQLAVGKTFGKFPIEEQKFRDDFPYEHTADQLQGIFDVFSDMEASTPMDRLLSGDVGFGKTEVAMNAVYKAFLSGMQVAVISPLVVLAMEHYESFIERLGKFGVKIKLLSRMSSKKEAENILKQMKSGQVDVVIGTHRLLSEDIKWKKLGLLIIDEEHKFGVLHKEKIKKMRAGIDILSLSATPIPRSLNLALSGLKKISILATPPKKKKPIETIITSWNENITKTAIENELSRGGQVIIVHNRIAGIESFKREIETILDSENAKIIITHGRMNGNEIDARIHDFKQQKYNILLTTTIIENGVNFLSANTIIIVDPEDFGMASLHQLRGRVGRKGEQGFCYLTYRKIILSNEEKERLITIANNNHLGAGFEIAMRDMEIRGAGYVLGIKQSGRSKDVGLPLYFRMLEEKIAELKHQKQTKIFTKIELDLSYIIPDNFFLSELDKLNFFREIENIDTIEELENLENEFMDENFEKNISNKENSKILPNTTEQKNISQLFLLLKARICFGQYHVEKISKNGNFYIFDFSKENTILDFKKFLDIFDDKKNMLVVSPQKIRIYQNIFDGSGDFLKKLLQKV